MQLEGMGLQGVLFGCLLHARVVLDPEARQECQAGWEWGVIYCNPHALVCILVYRKSFIYLFILYVNNYLPIIANIYSNILSK